MADGKITQLKKKIAGVVYKVYPRTLDTLVECGDGKNAAEKIAEILTLIEGKPTMNEVNERIKELIGNAPDALDTLKELAAALNNDPNFAANVTTALTAKGRVIFGTDPGDMTENDLLLEEIT